MSEEQRCRPGWAWAQLRLLEDEGVENADMETVHSALFGSAFSMADLRAERNIWIGYGK